MVWDFINIFTTLLLIIGLVSKKYITYILATLLLVLIIIFNAYKRAIKGISTKTYYLFITIFYVILISSIMLKHGWMDIIPILIGVLGDGIETITANLFKLFFNGYINLIYLLITILILVFLRKIGLNIVSLFIYHLLFKIVAPIFSIVCLVISLNTQNWKEGFLILSNILALFYLLIGLYYIIFGIFSSKK